MAKLIKLRVIQIKPFIHLSLTYLPSFFLRPNEPIYVSRLM